MRPLLAIGSALLAGAIGLGALTLYALEGHEVVVLHTHAADGTVRATRTWIADDDGALWIEAAVPERPFFRDILGHPEVEVERGGTARRYRAMPMPNPAGHLHIRRALAEKYGWADCWIGLLTDTTRSVETRLDPSS